MPKSPMSKPRRSLRQISLFISFVMFFNVLSPAITAGFVYAEELTDVQQTQTTETPEKPEESKNPTEETAQPETSTPAESATQEETPAETQPETPVEADKGASETPSTEVDTPAETPSEVQTPAETPTEEPIQPEQTAPQWLISPDGKTAVLNEAVKVGVKYVAPQNPEVTLVFSKLPAQPGTTTITEVTLSEELKKKLGAISNVAYEINSTMENGTFAYDLTLPKPRTSKPLKVIYSEDWKNFSEVQGEQVTATKVMIDDLNHFTLFVISADTNGTNGSGAYTAATDGIPSFTESAVNKIGLGTIIINTPAGFEFNTAGAVTVEVNCTAGCAADTDNINNVANNATFVVDSISGSQITFTISDQSSAGVENSLTLHGIEIRPTVGNPLAADAPFTITGTADLTGITVNLNGDSFSEVAGAVNAGTSTVDATPAAIPADGTTSDITVTLNDAFGNPVAGKDVSLAQTAGTGTPTIVTISGTTNAAGQATFTVASTDNYVGTFTATNTTDAIVITDTTNVTFGDVVAPTLVEVTPVTTPTTDTTPSYTFSSDEAGNITYGGSCSSVTAVAAVGNNVIDFNALADGTYTDCTITVTDAVGNVSNVLDVSDFAIDTTAPNMPTLLTPADGADVQPTTLILDWSDETDINGPVTYIYQSALSATTGAQNALTAPIYTSGALAASQIDASGSADNTYYWQARACDALNNCSDWSLPFEITIDGTAPVVTVNAKLTNDSTPSLTGTVNDNSATINVNVNGNNYAATNNGDGTWTLANNAIAPALTTGVYEVVVTATDGVANVGTDATNNELEIDLVDPVVAVTFPADGAYVNTNTIAIRGTVQDDNLLRYFYQIWDPTNTSIASQTVVTSTSFTDQVIYTLNATARPDGVYTIRLRARDIDASGNDAEVNTTFTLDRVNPVLTEVTPVTTPSNDSTPSYTFNSTEAGALVFGGACSSATTTAVVGNNIIDFSALADGTYTDCTITLTDAATNVSNILDVSDFTIDTGNPAIGTMILTRNDTTNTYVTGNNLRIRVNSVTDPIGIARCEYMLRDATNTTDLIGAWQPITHNIVNNRCVLNPGVNVDTAFGIAEGTQVTVVVRAVDNAGNLSSEVSTVRILDYYAPDFNSSTVTPLVGGFTSPNPTVTGDFTDRNSITDIVTCQYRYRVVAGVYGAWATGVLTPNGGDASNATCAANPTGLADGAYNVQLRVSDAVNHARTRTITIDVDAITPETDVVDYTPDPTNDNTPSLTGNATDADSGVAGVEYSFDGITWIPATATDSTFDSTNEDFNFTTGVLTDGTYTIQVRAIDAVGNVDPTPDSTTFTVDTVSPVIAEVTPVPTPDNDSTPSYTFSSDETGTITYGGSCSSATTTAIVGNNTIDFNTLADGTYTDCTITVTDAAGNASNVLDVSDFTIDTVAPTLAEVTPVTNPTNDATPAYTFSSDEVGDIAYGGSCSSATATAVAGNNTIDFSTLVEGTYTDCTITVTDAAGNVSNVLDVSDFTIDTTAPVLAEVTPVITPDNDSTPAYTFSSDEAGNIAYGGSCSSGTATAIAGNNTIDFNTLVDGTYTDCTVTVTDAAGNASNVLAVSDFTIDTVAPVVTEITPVPTPDNDATPSYTFNTDEAGAITYGGSCSSATSSAVVGNNTITFNTLADGTYTDCTITVTDAAGNASNVLDVSDFTVDTTAPVLVLGNVTVNEIVGSVPGPSSINNPEGLTISYSGVTVANLQLAPNQASKTVTRTASVTDAAGNTTTTSYTITVNNVGLNIPVLFGNSPATNSGVINITEDTNFTVGTNVTGGNAPYTFTFGGVCAGTGTTSNTLNLNPGTYGCTVTATDSDGDTRSGSVSIVVASTGTTPPVGEEGPTDEGQVAGETDGEEEEETGGVLGALTCDQRATVRGNVYIDANGNKVKDTNEGGVNNITVELYTTASEFILRTTTNSEGIYQTDICPGTYNVRVTSTNMPANSSVDSTSKNVTVSLTSTTNGVDFIVTVTTPAATSDFPWWAVILAAVVLLLLIAGYLISRRRGEQEYSYNG